MAKQRWIATFNGGVLGYTLTKLRRHHGLVFHPPFKGVPKEVLDYCCIEQSVTNQNIFTFVGNLPLVHPPSVFVFWRRNGSECVVKFSVEVGREGKEGK